jgi:tetratricopeptide (TPR) repeat protein
VFFVAADSTGVEKAVGQVEQLQSSRCYRESRGKLGCISCHDPHRTPTTEERPAFYRERCQTCHASNGCSLPVADRMQQSPDDSCIQCHMPRRDTNIAHTAMSDHRILRQPDQKKEPLIAPRRDQPDGNLLVHFHAEQADPRDPGISRDRGIGLTLLAQTPEGRAARTSLGQMAVPLLKPAVTAWPADVAAWEALGYAYWLQGQVQQAQESYDTALRLAPDREKVLVDLAQLNAGIGRREAAIGYCQRAIAVNPYVSSYYAGLAELYASGGEWEKSVAACQSALKLNPADRETRKMLVSSYLRMGDRQQALAEFEVFVQLDPPEREQALRKWLADQM